MHVNDTFPLYCHEAYLRMQYYDEPHIFGWLFYDGNRHGTINSATWRAKITGRMAQSAPVTVTMWGDYNLVEGTGTIYTQFRNDSTEEITGRVIFVVTEDSIYYESPNGDDWHNHVARDYLPDWNGTIVTIASGDSVTVNQPFTVSGGWDEDKCDIIAWIQNDTPQADSTREVWQGGIMKVMELGIEDEKGTDISNHGIRIRPNPCVNSTEFTFDLPLGIEYQIKIYDVSGRRIRAINGITKECQESVRWNRRDDAGSRVCAGVYIYQFESKVTKAFGKIVVR